MRCDETISHPHYWCWRPNLENHGNYASQNFCCAANVKWTCYVMPKLLEQHGHWVMLRNPNVTESQEWCWKRKIIYVKQEKRNNLHTVHNTTYSNWNHLHHMVVQWLQQIMHVYMPVWGYLQYSNFLNIQEGKKFLKKNFISSYGWTCKKDRNKSGMRKLKNATLLRNDGSLLFGLQRNALASLVHFVVCKWTRDGSALRWRPERRLHAIIP